MLGPFYDLDGTEILPATTEATDRVIELALGTYRVAAHPQIPARKLLRVTPSRLTRYIQDDWNQVFSARPRRGFLLAYSGSAAAAGRLVEELIAVELLKHLRWHGDRAQSVVPVAHGVAAGWIQRPARGVRSDDLLVRTQHGHLWVVEVKGSHRGTRYLPRSRTKARRQLAATLAMNPSITAGIHIQVSMHTKHIELRGASRRSWLSRHALGNAMRSGRRSKM